MESQIGHSPRGIDSACKWAFGFPGPASGYDLDTQFLNKTKTKRVLIQGMVRSYPTGIHSTLEVASGLRAELQVPRLLLLSALKSLHFALGLKVAMLFWRGSQGWEGGSSTAPLLSCLVPDPPQASAGGKRCGEIARVTVTGTLLHVRFEALHLY